MVARGVSASTFDARAAEVERILGSPVFHSSESLRRLLRYLVNRAIQEPGTPIREHEIAVDVFGRSEFDPRIDSTVRVNIARLRAKLLEYYGGPGASSEINLELPKGSYTVVFQPRPVAETVPEVIAGELKPATRPEAIPSPVSEKSNERVNRLLAFALISMTAIAGMLAATLMFEDGSRHPKPVTAVNQEIPSVRRFWEMLLSGRRDPWVVFSNAVFVGRPATGMRYMVPSRDSGHDVLDFYTGTGEVLGIHVLDRMFALLNRSIQVKRGGLLSLDDVENNDVVYVGSPLENLTLRDVPGLQDFAFRLIDKGPMSGEGSLLNLAARPGEPAVFQPSTFPLTKDFAVIALVPGLNPSHWALILAGTSTIGTQGAVEYVCREDTVHELLKRLGSTPGGQLPLFEAVLEIDIKGGVPVHGKLVAMHLRPVSNDSKGR